MLKVLVWWPELDHDIGPRMPKLLAQSIIGTAYTLELAKLAMVTISHRFCGTLQSLDVLSGN